MKGTTRGLREEWMEGNYLRSRGLNDLIGKFKMMVGEVIGIGGSL